MSERPQIAGSRRATLKRLVPLAVIAAALAVILLLDLDRYLSLEALKEHREALTAFVAHNALLAAATFMLLYAVATALSVPGALVLTIAGGFLFGSLLATLYVVVGATLGATAVFLAARTALGDSLRRRAGPWLKRMEAGFQENAFSYLLVLRLVPLFPFFVVNLVPAFLGVGLRTYVVATFLGIIPGTYVYALAGAGLGSVFDQGGEVTLGGILTPEVVGALIGLSLLSLLPVVYKWWKTRRGG
ncbi:TVP38/TMEM64 family protein [Tistlia consotensis]|nr:TVP38/TMEM64 family protein [Tistlia consotensis]